jgi:acyl-coenzyme A synthetase/AMP-(fatty) acid ligase
MMIQLLRAKEMCQNYDLSSVRFVFSGAAPLGEEVMNEVEKRFPTWKIGQAYGKSLQHARPATVSHT